VAGVPVVILQNYGRGPFKQWHYAVIVGYDSRSGNLMLRSGETRDHIEHIAIFEYTWKDSGRWAMVAVPPGRVPATADRTRYFNAIVAVERAGQHRAAVQAYETFLARWPDDLGAGIGLANAHHALGELDLTEAALRRTLEHHPDSVVALNNLAQTLSDAGRSEEALQLIERVDAGGAYAQSVSETRALILQRLQRN
jgi:tetratricopeptide (TPR) repeat protein